MIPAATAHQGAADGHTGAPPPGFDAPVPGTYALPIVRAAADGEIIDERGEKGTLHALFADKFVVLSFIFTHCADANGCPLASYILRQVGTAVLADPALQSRVRLVSFSFDPSRDTPEVLTAYAQPFRKPGMDWHFVSTPEPQALTSVLAAYGQALQRDPDGNAFSHQLRVFLIDDRGRIRNEYSAAYLHAPTVVADLKTLALDPVASVLPVAATLASPGDNKDGYESTDYRTDSRAVATRQGTPNSPTGDALPLGLPQIQPEKTAPTAAQIALGRQLFFDRRLSHNHTVACGSCHLPDHGFTNNELKTPVGIEGRTVKRNAPSLYNVMYRPTLFLDQRESRLEQQVWGPLLAHNEMGNPSIGFVLDRLAALGYRELFAAAFGELTMESFGAAIAAYERTLVSGNSAFDRWYFGNEPTALSEPARRGFDLFRGKAGCIACHTVQEKFAHFTDDNSHNTGLGFQYSMQDNHTEAILAGPGISLVLKPEASQGLDKLSTNDLGRYEITQDPQDRWQFRTPSLRNVALTAPYMHDGSLATLSEVVEFYRQGGVPHDGLDPLIKPLDLSEDEVRELVAFLQALTGDNVEALARDAFSQAIGDR